jgi:uncharacterized protein (TIGR03067 family)
MLADSQDTPRPLPDVGSPNEIDQLKHAIDTNDFEHVKALMIRNPHTSTPTAPQAYGHGVFWWLARIGKNQVAATRSGLFVPRTPRASQKDPSFLDQRRLLYRGTGQNQRQETAMSAVSATQARKILGARLVRRGLSLSGALAPSVLYDHVASAALPARLVNLTLEVVKLFTAGGARSSAISTKVAALTEGVLKTMLLKIRGLTAFFLVLGAVAAGAIIPILPRAVALAEGIEEANPPRADLPRTVALAPQHQESKPADEVSFIFGQIVQAHFFLKNTGKNPIEVSFPRVIERSYYRSLLFLDKEGGQLPVHHRDEPGVPVGWLATRLAGGKYAEIAGGFLSIGEGADKDSAEAIFKAKPGGVYRVQYTLDNYGDSKAGDLQTGEFAFTVVEKGTPRPRRLAARELKKRIAWGTPGKNGLQVGLVLLPADDENPARTPGPAEDPAGKDSQALQGAWEGQSGERDSKALADEEIKKIRVSIKGDRMLLIPGAEWTPLKFTLDPAKQPKVLYAKAVEGPDQDRTVPVIYRLDREADTLTLCFDERSGKVMPQDFAARKDSGLILLVLKHELRTPAAKQ